MSIHISRPVWGAVIEPPTLKFVAVRIADSANDDGTCWPSVRRIAMDCGLSERMVRRHLAELEQKGWITRIVRLRPDGSQTSNLIQWNLAALEEVEARQVGENRRFSSEGPILPGMAATPGHHRQAGRSYMTGGGANGDRPSEPSIEPSMNRNTPLPPKGGSLEKKPAGEFPPEPDDDPAPEEEPPTPSKAPSASPHDSVPPTYEEALRAAWPPGKPPKATPASPPPPTGDQAAAQEILRWLNQRTHREGHSAFRAVPATLKAIIACLRDVDGDADGVMKMIDRQVALWGPNPEMREYLRPSTLFRRSKFQEYYDSREMPIASPRGKGLNRDSYGQHLIQETIRQPRILAS